MLDKRIAYYLKKYADYICIHPSKKRNSYRLERLALYKRLMHQQIKKEGY